MTQAVVLPRLRRAFTDPTGHLVVAQMVVAAAALIVNILAARSLRPPEVAASAVINLIVFGRPDS